MPAPTTATSKGLLLGGGLLRSRLVRVLLAKRLGVFLNSLFLAVAAGLDFFVADSHRTDEDTRSGR